MSIARNVYSPVVSDVQDKDDLFTTSEKMALERALEESQSLVKQSETVSAPKAAGRPRSETSRQAILDATWKMLLHTSVKDISIEAIAKKANVGKTTIYRWWPNKVSVILDAVNGQMMFPPSQVSGNSAKELMIGQMERFGKTLKGRTGRIIAEVFAETQGSQELLEIYYKNFMLQHEEILANIVEQGKQSGEFSPVADTALVVDMIYGSVFYRLMSNPDSIQPEFFDSLAILALKVLSVYKVAA